jgi:hypothetical protein
MSVKEWIISAVILSTVIAGVVIGLSVVFSGIQVMGYLIDNVIK